MINQQLMDQALNMITSLPLQFFKMCCRPPHAKLELILFKKPLHHSKMQFDGSQDTEDLEWASADLGEWDDNK